MRFICRPLSPFSLIHSSFRPNSHRPGDNRQIGEHQTKGKARHKAEWVKPSRYDDEGQNVGDENVGVELESVRHDAGVYRAARLHATRKRAPVFDQVSGR